ncbi:MAG: accessory factor UbiK family protein [Alphaproteobacteria bacterium]|jgi:BMFP domain-containing protein YqiC|tara:strand:- start:28755 stop:29057 length:303 start_codon:yes stop_codon:yes gene_type:complete
MVQTTSKLFDEIAKVLTSTAGAAQGLKSELDVVIKAQSERLLNDLDVVQREEFDALKTMLVKSREKNDILEGRINELEKLIKHNIKNQKVTKKNTIIKDK